jgi:hypothetical protein
MILRRVPSICHPVAEAIDEIPVVGIGHVLVGMRRASALYLGDGFCGLLAALVRIPAEFVCAAHRVGSQ